MIYVYVIKSGKDKGYYIGITKDIDKRLNKHNKGQVSSTKNRRPFELMHKEKFNDYKSARRREKQVKSWHGGNAFRKLIGRPAGSSNGRTTDSGSVYLGSNPSPAAVSISKFGGVK